MTKLRIVLVILLGLSMIRAIPTVKPTSKPLSRTTVKPTEKKSLIAAEAKIDIPVKSKMAVENVEEPKKGARAKKSPAICIEVKSGLNEQLNTNYDQSSGAASPSGPNYPQYLPAIYVEPQNPSMTNFQPQPPSPSSINGQLPQHPVQPPIMMYQPGQNPMTDYPSGDPLINYYQHGQPPMPDSQTGQSSIIYYQPGQPSMTDYQPGQTPMLNYQPGQPPIPYYYHSPIDSLPGQFSVSVNTWSEPQPYYPNGQSVQSNYPYALPPSSIPNLFGVEPCPNYCCPSSSMPQPPPSSGSASDQSPSPLASTPRPALPSGQTPVQPTYPCLSPPMLIPSSSASGFHIDYHIHPCHRNSMSQSPTGMRINDESNVNESSQPDAIMDDNGKNFDTPFARTFTKKPAQHTAVSSTINECPPCPSDSAIKAVPYISTGPAPFRPEYHSGHMVYPMAPPQGYYQPYQVVPQHRSHQQIRHQRQQNEQKAKDAEADEKLKDQSGTIIPSKVINEMTESQQKLRPTMQTFPREQDDKRDNKGQINIRIPSSGQSFVLGTNSIEKSSEILNKEDISKRDTK